MSLTPQIAATPGNPLTYNPNIAETYSWVPITGAGRDLYAKATYDIANAQALGQNGFVITSSNDTTQYSGAFTTIQTLTSTKFAGITASNCVIGNALTTIELPQGFTINGPITEFKLQYGAVIAYKA